MKSQNKVKTARKSVRIATVYDRGSHDEFQTYPMDLLRWLRISESLADIGYEVDIIVNTKQGLVQRNPNLRYVPYSMVDWKRYDVIKTDFHKGFDSICREGQDDHPFIISKLGSVVGDSDAAEGVHFFGEEREYLYEMQRRINEKSRYIAILTEPSILLWEREFGGNGKILMVPTGVDREIPLPSENPYKGFDEKIAVYIGNLYVDTQREVNLIWQNKLNVLGKLLKRNGIRLCFVGVGNLDRIDPDAVTYLGAVENDRVWDYQYFADVGLTLAQGKIQHNESSKIYYYLRTGLPVVSEHPVPNNHLIEEANLGFIADYEDDRMMAEMIGEAAYKKWDKENAVQYILKNHTWDERVKIYDTLIEKEFGLGEEKLRSKIY